MSTRFHGRLRESSSTLCRILELRHTSQVELFLREEGMLGWAQEATRQLRMEASMSSRG